MKVELIPGKRYKARVRTSIGSQLMTGLLRTKLAVAGFVDITLASRRNEVEVSALYQGKHIKIELAYDILELKQVG